MGALEAGEVNAHAAGVLLRADRPEVHDVFAECEKELVDAAKHLTHDEPVNQLRSWSDIVISPPQSATSTT